MTTSIEHWRVVRWFTLPLLSALSVTGTTRDALACQPGSGIVSDVIPSGGKHPANAVVVLFGSTLDQLGLTATVDGAAAAISVDASLSHLVPSEGGYRTLALRFDPEPQPGQEVVVSGQPCAFNQTASCDDFEVRYIADAPDTMSISSALDWGYHISYSSVIPGRDEWYIDSCGEYPRAGGLSVSGLPTEPLDQDVMLELDGAPTATTSEGQSEFRYVGRLDPAGFHAWLPVFVNQLATPLSETELCVTARLVDAAGNTSETQEICNPCTISHGGASCLPGSPVCPTNVDLTEFDACSVEPDPNDGGAGGSSSANSEEQSGTDTEGGTDAEGGTAEGGTDARPSPRDEPGSTDVDSGTSADPDQSADSEPDAGNSPDSGRTPSGSGMDDDADGRNHDDTKRAVVESDDAPGCACTVGRPSRVLTAASPWWLRLLIWRRRRV